MMLVRRSRLGLAAFAAALLLGACDRARGEIGVTTDEIVIGNCVDLNSPAGERGRKRISAARLYFDHVNARGGVNGRKLRLVSLDDSYDPEKSIECFNKLMGERVFAGAFFLGSVPAAKYVEMAQRNKVPTLGFNAGAEFLFEPVKRYVFNTRASFKSAMGQLVHELWKQQGLRKFAAIYESDALGANIVGGLRQGLGVYSAAPVALGVMSRDGSDLDRALNSVRQANPEVVVLASLGASAARVVHRAKAMGWHPLFIMPTNDPTFLKLAGEDAEGLMQLQYVPSPSRGDLPSVALYNKLVAKNLRGAKPDFFGLESFMDAIILVEGLRAAGPSLTREGFVQGLESLHGVDIGLGPDFRVSYDAQDHAAFDRIYYTYVKDGRVVDLKDWNAVLRNRKG